MIGIGIGGVLVALLFLWLGLRTWMMHKRGRAGLFIGAALLAFGLGWAPGVLAGFKPLAIPHVSRVAQALGVPIQPTWTLILGETLSGTPQFVDAGGTPALFVAPTKADAQVVLRVEAALRHWRIARPVLVIGTHFADPATARAVWAAWIRRYHITLPTIIQEGPPTLYVRQTPVLVTEVKTRWVRITTPTAIASWARRHGGIVAPAVGGHSPSTS